MDTNKLLIPEFFSRPPLSPAAWDHCLDLIERSYPQHNTEPLEGQGGCSYTVRLLLKRPDSPLQDQLAIESEQAEAAVIVQFRLAKYAVPIDMAVAAHRVYSPLAPYTRQLDYFPVGDGQKIQALGMSCIDGQRYSDVQPRTKQLDVATFERLECLLKSISTFFAKQWCVGTKHKDVLAGCPGKVGSSLLFRLGSLERHLPTEALRGRARQTREAVEKGVLNGLRVVLTHGDLVPSNIMVDATTWMVKGYVDWAEAEMLPWGLCQYGIEHLLGYMETDTFGEPRFVYYDQAQGLRATFFGSLEKLVPELRKPELRAARLLTAHIGIFLWHGFAWDDGSIDRVVNANDDAVELAYLMAFLAAKDAELGHTVV